MRKRGFLAGLAAGLAAFATVLAMAAPVMADYPTVDTSQAGTLTIENYPVEGAQFLQGREGHGAGQSRSE